MQVLNIFGHTEIMSEIFLHFYFLQYSGDKEMDLASHFIVMCSHKLSGAMYHGLCRSQCCAWMKQAKSNVLNPPTFQMSKSIEIEIKKAIIWLGSHLLLRNYYLARKILHFF